MQKLLDQIKFKEGLVPAIIADKDSGAVLTLCYLNREALEKSLETGIIHLFRRSRGRLMKKGETSGHVQHIREIRVDCSGNSLLIYVKQQVAGCHKGYFTCFYRSYNSEEDRLEVVEEKVFDPDTVY